MEQTREETETEKMTHLESLVELGLSSTFSTILTQCSKEIFMVRIHYYKKLNSNLLVLFDVLKIELQVTLSVYINASISFLSILKFEKDTQLILIIHKFCICKFTYLPT